MHSWLPCPQIFTELDGQALAALGAAGVDDGPTRLGAHALAEAVFALPLQIAGLEGPFQG